jgi:hypothetical protein
MGLNPVSREDGTNNRVVIHELCGFQGGVDRRIVVMKEPAVCAQKFWFFVAHFPSSISKCHSKSQELIVV